MNECRDAGDARRPTLAGVAITLRAVRDADIPRLLAILDEPEVARWWRRSEWERVDEQDAATFAIVLGEQAAAGSLADGGPVVGCIQYTEETDPDYFSAAVDVFVTAAVHGRGVGPDAMRTLIAWLIDGRGHHRFTVDPACDNAHAIHVYERLGFRRVGVLREYERVERGAWRGALLMELVAGDFVRVRPARGRRGGGLR